MIGSGAYNYIDVLNKAAQASWKRNELIANNLANVDTPGYKRKDLDFESLLKEQMTQGHTNNLDKKVSNIDLKKLNPHAFTEFAELDYRYDGNNVDIDMENAYLADNQMKYYMYMNSMTQEFNRIKTVLNNG